MWNTLPASLLALVITWALAVPAAASNKEQQLAADIRILQEQTQQLHVLIGTIGDAIRAVNSRLDDQHAAVRKAFADERLTIDTLSADLRVVREKVDDNNVRIASLTQEIEQLRQMVQQQSALARPSPAEPAGGMPPEPGGQAPPQPGGGAPPAAAALGTSPQRLFDQAFSDYTSAQWDLAILGFQSYVRTFPKSDLADEAQLHIAGSYLNDAKYDKAIEACDILIRTYPTANTIPDAYYRKGLALASLKQPDRAREAFEFVIKNYPDTDPGRLAKQRIEQLPKPN